MTRKINFVCIRAHSQTFTMNLGVKAQNSHKDTEAFQFLSLSLKEWLAEGVVCRSTF